MEQSQEGSPLFRFEVPRLQTALDYLAENEPTWILNPDTVPVEQPKDQAVMLQGVEQELRARPEGEWLVRLFRYNLDRAKDFSSNNAQGFSRHALKAGFKINQLDTGELTTQEYLALERHADMEIEDLEFHKEPGPLMAGMLEATGATCLRDDILDGNDIGHKIYKGMLFGHTIYFAEIIDHTYTHDEMGLMIPCGYARRFLTVGKKLAAAFLDELSEKDKRIQDALGIKRPYINESSFSHKIYPGRQRFAETIRLYATIGHTG